jgi:hypothetical protein
MLELTAYCIFYIKTINTILKKLLITRARKLQGIVHFSIYLDIQWKKCGAVSVMVFNTNLSNISVISWRSVLLVEEIGVPREKH